MPRGRSCTGVKHWNVKLTEEDVLWIRWRYLQGGITKVELATVFGVSKSLIGVILCRKAWKHI